MKKISWVLKEYKKGWRAGMATNKETKWLPVWFKTPEYFMELLGAGIVFIHLKKHDMVLDKEGEVGK
jgi:hypothetical protein